MKYDEITRMVTGSSVDDWAVLQVGPLYLDELAEVSSSDGHWIEIGSHDSMAIYRPDVNLRLAWGLERDGHPAFEGPPWPDAKITRRLADAFWHGSLVARWGYLVVDGGRCYLPDPERDVRTGDSPTDLEVGPWTAKASEVALARLLNDLVLRLDGEFARYFEESGIVEVPGDQAGGPRHRILE